MEKQGFQLSASHSSAHSQSYGSPRKTKGLDVNWHFLGKRLDDHGGKYPTVSLAGSTAVVIHNSAMGNSMWYWVGRLDEVKYEIYWNKGRHFAYGLHPSVALKENGLLVVVHRSQWRHELMYTLGKVNGDHMGGEYSIYDHIKWGKCQTYANGVDASVAINSSDSVVAVHVSREARIQCMVGEASSKSIRWSSPSPLGTGGNPRVAINDSNTVVIIYQSKSGIGIQCQVGIANGMSVFWGRCIEYANGLNGSVALTTYNHILIVRQWLRLDELSYGVAKIVLKDKKIMEESEDVEMCRNRKLSEHKIPKYGKGSSEFFWHPAISVNDQGRVLVVFASNGANGRALKYCLGNLNETEDTSQSSDSSSDEEQYLSTPSDEC